MAKKKVDVYDKAEQELMHVGRRTPQKKKSVYKIVFQHLQKAYNDGKINQVTFDEVNKKVREQFPFSRFNPYHLAHYKHKFLVEAPS